MKHQTYFNSLLTSIQNQEESLNLLLHSQDIVQIINNLQLILYQLSAYLLNSTLTLEEEIYFFKVVKPTILGKLIYYNKIYRLESSLNRQMHLDKKFFSKKLTQLKNQSKKYIRKSSFYKYYINNRTDKDHLYFSRGNIDLKEGLSSVAFKIDMEFSTYYDIKVAKIIADNMFYSYLKDQLYLLEQQEVYSSKSNKVKSQTLHWSESQNALIELIYALYVTGSIGHRRIEIKKIAIVFQELFQIPLGDIHHAFHRMKTRAKSRTCYLDKLKQGLEEYMDKDI
ncbi:RteC domain-containing protein [Myroides sp. TSA_177.3]|uniref:RteC domain-containing protein n=1 Tax=Myroides sp. TSA_177.3 TaxID=3415650 RepID=UPI0040453EFE